MTAAVDVVPEPVAHRPRSTHAAPARQLLRRIESRYRVVDRDRRVGALSFPFTRIADPDRVLDEVAAEEDRLEKVSGKRADGDYLHLPYWAELWDSAAGIATCARERPTPL